jgi:hypothetical protein
MIFGRDIKGPGDWQLELAEEPPEESGTGPEFPEAGRNASEEPGVSSMKPDDASVKEKNVLTVAGQKAVRTHRQPEPPGRTRLSVRDWVYYKAHPPSSAEKRVHAGFAPKWLGPVRLCKRLGTGVFLTEGKHPTKLHVSAMKQAVIPSENTN